MNICILGLSICQELALDEDEEEGREVVGGEGNDLLHTGEVQTPVQLSNALMKALKVGRDDDRAEPTPTQQQPKNQDDGRKNGIMFFVNNLYTSCMSIMPLKSKFSRNHDKYLKCQTY